jgi:hypothetical protein
MKTKLPEISRARAAKLEAAKLVLSIITALLIALPYANAALTQVTVTLDDPNGLPPPGPPFTFSDTVSVVPGKEIFPGNPTNIGSSNVLLNNESVDAQAGDRIVLGLEAGAGSNTGYGPGASYLFSNFGFSSPSIVTGVSVSLDNISGVALGNQVVFGNGSVQVFIDTLTIPAFKDACNGVQCGSITLDLIVSQIPEPAGYAVLAIGLAALVMHRRLTGRRR